jgi:hypothetical protein
MLTLHSAEGAKMSRLAAIGLVLFFVLGLACSENTCTKPDDDDPEPDPFFMKAYPDTIHDAEPSQICVFLIEFSNAGEADSIYLSAEAIGGGRFGPSAWVPLSPLEPRQIGEVEVRIDPLGEENDTVSVVIEARAGDAVFADTCVIFVYRSYGSPEQYAREVLEEFSDWFEDHQPGLGIARWIWRDGTIVLPHIFGACHYLFFSRDWELGMMWPVVPPPSDCVRVYLRRRYTEMVPSYAYRMDSFSQHTEPYPIDPPDEVTR